MNYIISLKTLSKSDLTDCVAILKNDVVKKTYMLPDFANDEEAVKLFDRLLELSVEDNRYVRGIYLDEKLIGIINDTEIFGAQIEIGWALHPDFHGKGYATQAVKYAVNDLFAKGFKVVVAGAFSENTASMRVMEKAGMHRIEKTEEISYRGENHTCIFYQIEN